MVIRKHTVALTALLVSALVVTSCGKKEGDDEETAETSGNPGAPGGQATAENLTLTGTLAIGASLTDAADLEVFCVTFEKTPRSGTSPIAAAGAFSVTMPKKASFGCFINTKDGDTVGTFVIKGSAKGLSDGSKSSMALSGDVDLGALTLSSDGKVEIPEEKLATQTYAPTTVDLAVDDLHDAVYTLTCLDTGVAANVAKCKKMLLDDQASMTVFMRIVKADLAGKQIQGLGVWASKAAFDNCGSFDMDAESAGSKDGQTISITQGAVGAWTGANCGKRQDGSELKKSNIEDYLLFSELVKNGAGYDVREETRDEDHGGGCKVNHFVSISFTGTSAEMYGAFGINESRHNCDGNTGDAVEGGSFNVMFKKN